MTLAAPHATIARMMRTLVLALLIAAPAAARAETPDEILKLADAAASSYKDLTLDETLAIREPSGAERVVALTVQLKDEHRVIRFTAPPDLKGMAILVLRRDALYALLPAFSDRVRRLGPQALGQSFVGSDLTNEDFTWSAYADVYQAKSAAAEAGAWIVGAAVKPDRAAEFPAIKVWVNRAAPHSITKIEYYDAKGTKARTETRSGFRKDEGGADHVSPSLIRVVDHRRDDHVSELRVVKARADQGLADELFTPRALSGTH